MTEFIVYFHDNRFGLEASFHVTGRDQYDDRVAVLVFDDPATARDYESGRRPLDRLVSNATDRTSGVVLRGRILGWTASDVPPTRRSALRQALLQLPAWVAHDSPH